jgi:hypothetical protein
MVPGPAREVLGREEGVHLPRARVCVSELLPRFARGYHLVVENATHQYLDLAHPDEARIMVDFYRGVEPKVGVLSAPPLTFERN